MEKIKNILTSAIPAIRRRADRIFNLSSLKSEVLYFFPFGSWRTISGFCIVHVTTKKVSFPIVLSMGTVPFTLFFPVIFKALLSNCYTNVNNNHMKLICYSSYNISKLVQSNSKCTFKRFQLK